MSYEMQEQERRTALLEGGASDRSEGERADGMAVQRQTAPASPAMRSTRATQRRAVQRIGQPLPGGARVDSCSGNADAIVNELNRVAASMWGAAPDFNVHATGVVAQIRAALGSNNFSTETIPINFTHYQSLNTRWQGSVRLNINNPRPVDSGTGTSGGGTSGQTTNSSGTSDANTHGGSVGANAEGSAGGHEGAPGGSVGVNGSANASNTRTDSNSTGGQGGRNTTVSGNTNQTMFEATICADISLSATLDYQGVGDWLKFGAYAAEAIAPIRPGHGSVSNAGTIRYTMATSLR